MTAVDRAAKMAKGEVSAREATGACLDRIEAREGDVQAWAHLDRAHAEAAAAALDDLPSSGRAIGPLHGVCVGVKDIFDTADMPTENGLAIGPVHDRPHVVSWSGSRKRHRRRLFLDGHLHGKDREEISRLRSATPGSVYQANDAPADRRRRKASPSLETDFVELVAPPLHPRASTYLPAS